MNKLQLLCVKMSTKIDKTNHHTWSALQETTFRWLWIATVISNIGTWIHEVGAAWLMTSLAPSPLMVALVQVATTAPFFVFALPAGALADLIDRRRLLLLAQGWSALMTFILAVISLTEHTTAPLLLILTFALGIGTTLTMPAWQAIVPEVISKPRLSSAVTLNSMSINIARALGPAIGGLIVAAAGPWAAFALNTITFTVVLVVLWRWRREVLMEALPPEDFFDAMRLGVQYVVYSKEVKAVLARAVAFIFPASALWSLLPLFAKQQLGLSASGYGGLLGLIGLGAVGTALIIGRIRQRLKPNRLILIASLIFASIMVALSMLNLSGWVALLMPPVGLAWLTVLSSLNYSAQTVVPNWVRARALSIYLLIFFGSMSLGALAWGIAANIVGIPATFLAAAICLAIGIVLAIRFPLIDSSELDLTPSGHWMLPSVAWEIKQDQGPVIITIEYKIAVDKQPQFLANTPYLRSMRLREGAYRWNLVKDIEDDTRLIETYTVGSWLQHLRQHERVTEMDRKIQETIKMFQTSANFPIVSHFIAVHPDKTQASVSKRSVSIKRG